MAWVICGAATLVCLWAVKETRQHSQLVDDPSSLRMIRITPKGYLQRFGGSPLASSSSP